MDWTLFSQHQQPLFETALRRRLDRIDLDPTLARAAKYALLAPAKRLRPLLLIAVAESLGGSSTQVEPAASALEFLHTYSLIHDDLPAMDDDDMRRGQPSLHRAFDEAVAILTGDFLLTESFALLAELPDASCRSLVHLFGQAASGSGMIGGQIVDIQQGATTVPALLEMYRRKTGLLFRLAAHAGSLLAGASHSVQSHFASFGENLGVAFQILDDLDDQESDPYSLLSLMGVEPAKELSRKYLQEAKKQLARVSSAQPLHSLLDTLSACII